MHLLGRDKPRAGKESRSSESCPTWSRSHRGAHGAFGTCGGSGWSSPWCHFCGAGFKKKKKKAFAAPPKLRGRVSAPCCATSAVSPEGTVAFCSPGDLPVPHKAFPAGFSLGPAGAAGRGHPLTHPGSPIRTSAGTGRDPQTPAPPRPVTTGVKIRHFSSPRDHRGEDSRPLRSL